MKKERTESSKPPPQDGRRVSMSDLAESLGISTMSVSRALRGVSGVSRELRERVQQEVERLGYQPDPMLSALNTYRVNRKPKQSQNSVAYLTRFSTRDGWREAQYVRIYFEGAKEAATRFGYTLEPFWLSATGMTQKRAGEILYNRGVMGLLIAPFPSSIRRGHLRLPWERFSCVAFGNSLEHPGLDRISLDFHQAVQTTCHQLRRLGYRRIGFGLSFNTDARHHHEPSDAFRGEQIRFPATGDVPVLTWKHSDPVMLREWFDTHQPDVLLTNRPGDFTRLWESLPPKTRDQLPVFYTSLYETDPQDLNGLVEGLRELGQRGMELLHSSVLQVRKGIPKRPVTLKMTGTWRHTL